MGIPSPCGRARDEGEGDAANQNGRTNRQVVADFSGSTLSSDGGVLLLRPVDASRGLTHRLAQCFSDARRQIYVDHSLPQLLAQRLSGLALGYEDLHDHQRLRLDPLLAAACDKRDPLGEERFNPAHRGVALAGASPLNRLELSIHKRTRAHKLAHDAGRLEACRLQTGVRCRPKYAEEIVVDLDAMGQRLLPGGDPGVVRTPSSGGRLLPGFGQALRAD